MSDKWRLLCFFKNVTYKWTTFYDKELLFSAHSRNNIPAISFFMQMGVFMNKPEIKELFVAKCSPKMTTLSFAWSCEAVVTLF